MHPLEDYIEDTTASTSSTGSANAAEITVPGGHTVVTVMWDTSGAATVTVEASVDGTNWYDVTLDFIDGTDVTQPGSAETKGATATIGTEFARIHVDSSLNTAEIAAKGL